MINLSSAAQSPVNLEALAGRVELPDLEAYAQSKLALTIWSRCHSEDLSGHGVAVIAVHPGSMLGTKMLREGFGVAGRDVGVGARVLARLATGPEFASASGRYFDNDAGRFGSPHPDVEKPLQRGRRSFGPSTEL